MMTSSAIPEFSTAPIQRGPIQRSRPRLPDSTAPFPGRVVIEGLSSFYASSPSSEGAISEGAMVERISRDPVIINVKPLPPMFPVPPIFPVNTVPAQIAMTEEKPNSWEVNEKGDQYTVTNNGGCVVLEGDLVLPSHSQVFDGSSSSPDSNLFTHVPDGTYPSPELHPVGSATESRLHSLIVGAISVVNTLSCGLIELCCVCPNPREQNVRTVLMNGDGFVVKSMTKQVNYETDQFITHSHEKHFPAGVSPHRFDLNDKA